MKKKILKVQLQKNMIIYIIIQNQKYQLIQIYMMIHHLMIYNLLKTLEKKIMKMKKKQKEIILIQISIKIIIKVNIIQ